MRIPLHRWKLKYNNFTLNFTGQDEVMFRQKYFNDSLFQFRFAFILIIVLYSSFGYLDTQLFAEYATFLFIVRFGVVVPLFAMVLLLSYTPYFLFEKFGKQPFLSLFLQEEQALH
ncbi:MAG: hypothetical protein PHX54_00025 [Lentimicrobiaceae bacterium]|nr:hypothetical protein [Lentimicrobiaceae bacterium]